MAEELKRKRADYNRTYREHRPSRFTLEFSGDENVKEELKRKLASVKQLISHSTGAVSNTDALNRILDFFIENNVPKHSGDDNSATATHGYTLVHREDVDQPIFLTTESSVNVLMKIALEHSSKCGCCLLQAKEKYKRGHASVLDITCSKCNVNLQNWPSSPYLPNHKFLVNYRMAHGYFSSGILPNQYERLTEFADIGHLSEQFLREHVAPDYNLAVDMEYNDNCAEALSEEIASAFFSHDGPMEECPGIKILTDARHGWRKNSRQTDVVCIGYKTHKVLRDEIITKVDDRFSQRHERLGTERIYKYFEENELRPTIDAHAHDRNLSINKYIREHHPDVQNQNDTWHAGKQVEKQVKTVAMGPNYLHGKTWHRELSDKVASIRTHIHYSIRECNGSPDILKAKLQNIVDHYKNIHTNCSENSSCRSFSNYQPSKEIIKDIRAENLLKQAIEKSVVYKHPEDFILAMDTFYVESFNNVLNMFHDKRISFGNEEYFRRSKLAVLHWNENVDRPISSIWTPPETNIAPYLGPRKPKSKKLYKKRTFGYVWNVWNTLVNLVFQ